MPDQTEQQRRQTRQAAIVIAVAFLGWMGVSFLGGQLGLPVRYAFLADFAALAALAWALIVLFRVWRQRQQGE
ncbi:DUF5337 family protein [Oceanomicrobium pacificus]|uniref:DUF5337 domain-containing protein n=1 Tax=Oceanomicrobium pacificus TaxID=2692916 RepID=A0A6B0TWG9_9RHOB|nr:DUF5337 family protein [Oceanomicrobium pacificus]MXU65602.1 hypothetical protein [Oceanomicrobium pacificus]